MNITRNRAMPGVEFMHIKRGEVFWIPREYRADNDELCMKTDQFSTGGGLVNAVGLTNGRLFGVKDWDMKVFRVAGSFHVENISELENAEEATHENQT